MSESDSDSETIPSLTKHLTSYPARYADAVRNLFLVRAAAGLIEHDLLALWLSQDRIYAAHAYPKFIGSLISRIPFDSKHSIDSDEEHFNERILKILLFSLQNVVRELEFFMKTAGDWGFSLDQAERKGTRNYTAEMARISNNEIYEGLIFLWAMEKASQTHCGIYLEAWTFVRDTSNSHITKSGSNMPLTYTHGAVLDLCKNWTSPEFVKFVDDLADIVDSLRIKPGSKEWTRAEEIWARVVELEADFWPTEDDL
ncbi:heme oxygenase-like protein [Lentinula raphanica]|nr:heme oxygenase-like protein [Lentinula raphanica]